MTRNLELSQSRLGFWPSLSESGLIGSPLMGLETGSKVYTKRRTIEGGA